MQYIYQSSPPAFTWSLFCTICHIKGEDIWIFPSLPTRTHPHEDDGSWYVQAVCNCLPRQHPKCTWRKPFFQGLLFCSTCKMATLLVGAVHILNNPVQWSLSARRRADGGMPALPAPVQLDTGQISCRNPATLLAASPSACTSLKQGFLSRAYGIGLLLHQCSCMASWHTPSCDTTHQIAYHLHTAYLQLKVNMKQQPRPAWALLLCHAHVPGSGSATFPLLPHTPSLLPSSATHASCQNTLSSLLKGQFIQLTHQDHLISSKHIQVLSRISSPSNWHLKSQKYFPVDISECSYKPSVPFLPRRRVSAHSHPWAFV